MPRNYRWGNKADRFWDQVEKTDSCWIWVGRSRTPNGYGKFDTTSAHRWLWQEIHGTLAADMTLDHLCRVRACVNPEHLEPVSLKENILRGNGFAAINARKVNCLRGHELLGANLYITPDGRRQCKSCLKIAGVKAKNKRAGISAKECG